METILYIGGIQALFASLCIFTKRSYSLADRVMAFWILAIGLAFFGRLILFHFDRAFLAASISRILPLTYGPCLFWYTRLMTSENQELPTKRVILHMMPGILFFVLYLILPIEQWMPREGEQYRLWRATNGIAILTSYITYSVKSIKILIRHKQKVLESFSYVSEHVTLNWLRIINNLFVFTYSANLIGSIFYRTLGLPMETSEKLILLNFTIFVYAISYFSFRQTRVFKNMKPEVVGIQEGPVIQTPKKDQKYEKSGLREDTAQEYLDKIMAFMEEKKPYMDGNLTIQDLAEALDIPRHHITQVLNERLEKNFYTFINEYRVNEAKLLIGDPSNDRLTLLALGFEAGFNSKTSFNTIFKKLTNETPSEYRKRIKQEEKS